MMGWDISIEEAENIADWTNQSFSNINDTGLASITAASDNLSNLGSEFNGATAGAVKGYWSEVHGRMVAALSAAVQQLAVSCSASSSSIRRRESIPPASSRMRSDRRQA
ncbi:MAG: LXG domain-containing protein [Olsenella sp.]|jgi:hypothetical protein|nr:LXG domain-containing protein [Olsenella sp.]MCI1793965.1 LXG domain-containing protein [Olsenella sp.]MCI1810414.1 LXG domain-containing protein [Olsenella sp.]